MTRSAHVVRVEPTREQQRAADPGASVWVSASAGTGKTRVLADRVLRLLLQGVAPERILCLTFTKAGAAEMVGRLQGDLARFAALDDDALMKELRALLGRAPGEQEKTRARCLLGLILDLPGGLAISTIHSFCQSLLRRFPLEAGIAPHFTVLEPRDADELMAQALDAVLETPGELESSIRTLAILVGERGFMEGLDALRQQRLRFDRALGRYGGKDGLIQAVAGALGLSSGTTIGELKREACTGCQDSPGLVAACQALQAGSEANRGAALGILAWLDADLERRLGLLDSYLSIFLTKKGDPRAPSNMAVKAVHAAAPEAIKALDTEQQRLAHFVERCRAVEVFEKSRALIEICAATLEEHERLKRVRAALDYDDLIERSADLLAQPDVAPWIQYKLDQRIDHLLVDEGQDTNPAQWAVIEALISDFFTGEGAATTVRTVFVVGDEKQSIFSFQGADLGAYRSMRERLRRSTRQARRRFHETSLTRSFRSVPAVLEVVDRVFARAEAASGLSEDGHVPPHESGRPDHPGVVELWPLIEVEPSPEPDAWELPDRPEPAERPERVQAEQIVARIVRWLDDGTPLPSTERPIRPGDMMILLRARTPIRDYLNREMKRRGVPVAGADRLRLIDEMAVNDLIALGDALLQPDDDLTLATVLKGPLFGLSEEQLFELAYDRQGTVSSRLASMATTDDAFRAAFDMLERLRGQVDRMPPFEFYARLLGDGGRQRMLGRLGPAAAEPIDAFLGQALLFERNHPPSLQGFLHSLRRDTSELMRDPDRPRDEVRLLTVHGAKGLEAPIVILPDATAVPRDQDRLLWLDGDLPLWNVGRDDRDEVSRCRAEAVRAASQDEERRLLYVAMTRARDWLIVAGRKRKNTPKDAPTWYDLVKGGLADHPDAERFEAADGGEMIQLVRRRRQAGLPLGEPVVPPPDVPPLPAFALHPAPDEPLQRSPLSPSRLVADEPPATSPSDPPSHDRLVRGRAIHRLLQILPGLPEHERLDAAERLLAGSMFELDRGSREQAIRDVMRLMDDPLLAPVFGPDSRAEVPIVGTIDGMPVSGQIDRLLVGPEEILLVDYKTNRVLPATPPRAYLCQLALYRRLLLSRFPGRRVRCGLLWTSIGSLEVVEDRALEEALGTAMCA